MKKTYSLHKNLGYFKSFKNKIWFIKFATCRQCVMRANFLYKHCFGSFFSSYVYVEKAAETTFVRKICT